MGSSPDLADELQKIYDSEINVRTSLPARSGDFELRAPQFVQNLLPARARKIGPGAHCPSWRWKPTFNACHLLPVAAAFWPADPD